MAETKSQCSGNCMACTIFQRQYCASQIAYNNMGLLSDLMNEISEIKSKIKEIHNNDTPLINPIEDE